MSKREQILAVVTVLVVICAGIFNVLTPPPVRPAASPAIARTPPEPLAPRSQTVPLVARQAASVPTLDLELLRQCLRASSTRDSLPSPTAAWDPFQSLSQEAEPSTTAAASMASRPAGGATTAPVFQGVFFSGQRRLALVDGRTVSQGARLQDLIVQEVRKNGVVCRRGNRTYLLGFDGLVPLW
ncbi:MAG: hypothetical protein HY303_02470 [Candidatus Wallbacteria bacterium]|nr:hypothetical protein [Candidatus Wallbacteria bacterium]